MAFKIPNLTVCQDSIRYYKEFKIVASDHESGKDWLRLRQNCLYRDLLATVFTLGLSATTVASIGLEDSTLSYLIIHASYTCRLQPSVQAPST